MKTVLAATLGAFALLAANSAAACMPMPPPPQEQDESAEAHHARVLAWQAARDAEDAAWRLQREQENWDQADSVFVARLERIGKADLNGSDVPRVTLRPITQLKGARHTSRFRLTYTEETSCGPLPAFDAVRGAVGDEFVVFIRGNRVRQETIYGATALANIADPRIQAAIEAARQ